MSHRKMQGATKGNRAGSKDDFGKKEGGGATMVTEQEKKSRGGGQEDGKEGVLLFSHTKGGLIFKK